MRQLDYLISKDKEGISLLVLHSCVRHELYNITALTSYLVIEGITCNYFNVIVQRYN